ncbi:hypothetical protein SHDE107825_00685 [Shewanella denitrificans]
MVHPSGLEPSNSTAAVNEERVVLCFIFLTIRNCKFQAQKKPAYAGLCSFRLYISIEMVHPSGLEPLTPTAAVNKERVVLCFILLTLGISEL